MATQTVTVTAKGRVKQVGKGYRYNLVPNPSFELNFDGWGADADFTRDNTDQYSGAYAVKQVSAAGQYSNFTTANDATGIAVKPNSRYILSFYYKLTINSGFAPYINVNRDSAYGSSLGNATLGAHAGWTRQTIQFDTPADVDRVWIKLSNNGGDVVGFYDAFMIEEGISATAYFDGSIAPASWDGSTHLSASRIPLNYIQARARIKGIGVTQTIQARARIGGLMTQVNIQAKANIISLSQTIPKQFLIPNRKGRFSLGFGTLLRRVFEGYSGMIKVTRSSRRAEAHFEDELTRLADSKLSGGELLIDIRTDRYIWGILDYVYQDYYTTIAAFESPESWTGGSSETTNHRGGNGAMALQSTGSNATMSLALSSLDLSAYVPSADYIDLFVFIDDVTVVESLKLKLGDATLTNYFLYQPDVADLITGWNQLHIKMEDFTETGSPTWGDIDKVQCEVDATGTNTVNTIWDELRAIDANNYPRRLIDVGLQFIPVAWWAGNTSLYEIRTACEAEGARFFSDDNGVLQFWNRQHFNNNDEFKNSKWQFSFNRMFDLEYPNDQTNIINKITVKLNPRKVVAAAEEIWRYGFTPSIAAGGTKDIWASFNDPVPADTSGLLTPVATTDFTANSAADGTGADRTSEFSIESVTRFTTAALITVKNNGANPSYLTMLRVRGTPAKSAADTSGIGSSITRIEIEDATSIAKYGERPAGGMTIENKYLANEADGLSLAEAILASNKDPLDRIILKARAVPSLNLGDMITVVNEDTGKSLLMRIVTYKVSMTPDGFNEEIHCRSVLAVESLTYFTINESAIEGVDVISP